MFINYRNDTQCNRKHHHGGSRIAQPHTQETGCNNKSQYDPVAARSGKTHDLQSDTLMEVPFLNCESNHESTHKQEDYRVAVCFRYLLKRADFQYRKQEKRDQRNSCNRQSFGYPPGNHQRGNSYSFAGIRLKRKRIEYSGKQSQCHSREKCKPILIFAEPVIHKKLS